MFTPEWPVCLSDLTNPDALALLEARLRRTQEALADQLIERRLDQERLATLRLQAQELDEQVAALRRALDSRNPEGPRSAVSSRRRRGR